MVKTEKISALQLICLIVVNRFLFSFSFMPTVTMSPANQDAWIVDLLSGVFLFILAIPLLILSNKFPKLSFNEYFQIILGKKIGKFICFIYGCYLAFISLLTVLLLSDFLISAVLPETPMYAIILFMIIPCCYATYKGLECIGRVAVVMAVFIISIILIYAIFNIPNMDFNVFLPILKDSSIKKLSYGVFNSATRFCDCFLFFLFIKNVNTTKKNTITKIFIITVTAFTIMNTLVTIFTQTVLGPELARIMKSPYFSSIQQINLFNIIQRIEFFNVIAWIIIMFIKLSSTNLAASMLFSQVFNTKTYKIFVSPINISTFLIIVFTSISFYPIITTLFTDVAYWFIFAVNFVIPFMILIVYLIRKKSLSKLNLNKI